MRGSARKIRVFLVAVSSVVVVVGSVMYVVEGPAHGFTSIPTAIYWAVVTLTTVGYGDISPRTPLGQALASVVMILGYGIIAVPTGIVTAEVIAAERASSGRAGGGRGRQCPGCGGGGHDADARHCKQCGARLP